MFEIILAIPVSAAFLFAPEFGFIPPAFTADWWLATLALLTLKIAICIAAQRTLSEERMARGTFALQGKPVPLAAPTVTDPVLLQTFAYLATVFAAGFLGPGMPLVLAGALSSWRWLGTSPMLAKPVISQPLTPRH